MTAVDDLLAEAAAITAINAKIGGTIIDASDIGSYAIELAVNNWAFGPLCHRQDHDPDLPHGKDPIRGGRGVLDFTTDVETVARWWGGPYRGHNIGARVPESMFVLDVDNLDALAELEWNTATARRMAPATDRPYQAVVTKTVTHDGDSRLAAHMAHCVAKSTPMGDLISQDKRGSPRKIDAAVAAIVAFDRVAWHKSTRKRTRSFGGAHRFPPICRRCCRSSTSPPAAIPSWTATTAGHKRFRFCPPRPRRR